MNDPIRPLDDIRVLDLTHFVNGPYATLLLSYMGAEVTKIEAPKWGDGMRVGYRPSKEVPIGIAFALMNANKRSITLNLKSDEGKAIFKRLVCKADVVVENYEAGTMDAMGLGYDVLKEVNPRIIYASSTGYGQTGPNRKLPAFDPIVQAMTGVMALTGRPSDPPLKAGVIMCDVLGAAHLCTGILGALRHRDRTGTGTMVEISMQEATLPTLVSHIAAHYGMGVQQLREGNRTSGGVVTPANAYPASDGWIMLMAADSNRWRRLCQLMERSDLIEDERLTKLSGRSRNRDEVDEIIGSWTRTKTRQQLMDLLAANDIICGIVKELPEVMSDPHMHQRGALREIDHPELGRTTIFTSPVRFNGQPNEPRSPSPAHGADSDSFYAAELGYTPEAIADLRDRKII
ncbi:MAG: CoA transferase [Candidatus Binataceae bacterium]|jgi:crotonobetainyl-CoA:carnitine CoA-transferase CaiB-like acyl-CoA transferase